MTKTQTSETDKILKRNVSNSNKEMESTFPELAKCYENAATNGDDNSERKTTV